MKKSHYLKGLAIQPKEITGKESVADLINNAFLAYNAARLREACLLLTTKILKPDVTVGVSLSGAMTPAGLGKSSLIPLIRNGFIDWLVTTGANLYHDLHFAIGLDLHKGNPFANDSLLRKEKVIRIYDIYFDYQVLLKTDEFIREVTKADEFQRTMSSAEFHFRLGKYAKEREAILGLHNASILSVAHQEGVPVFTPAPGDSSIGMNIARQALEGYQVKLDVSRDVNASAAIVLHAKKKGKSALLIFGGGSPKNFMLQTEPQLQEILEIEDDGHDYFIQITDARPDTGGLSGATPSEAVTWGKVTPDTLSRAVVCYVDTTIALPILCSYVLAKQTPRPQARLYDKLDLLLDELAKTFARKNN